MDLTELHSRRPRTYTSGGLLLTAALLLLLGCGVSSPRFLTKHRIQESSPIDDSLLTRTPMTDSTDEASSVDIESVLPSTKLAPADSTVDRQKVMDEVLALVGVPYARNGTDSSGMDCSAFTARIYADAMSRRLPHSSLEQYQMSTPVTDHDRMFGDLVFFNTTGENPSHVGIYLGENLFAHASVSNGVTISSLESSYYRTRYLGARRPAQ